MTLIALNNELHIYFITAKIEGGKHLFVDKNLAMMVLNSLDFLHQQKRIKLFAFVVMPNHLHFLAKPLDNWTVKKVCTNFERFTAHQIVEFLKQKEKQDLLNFFNEQAKNYQDRSYKIWYSILAKNCYSEGFTRQKLNYIHDNPIRKGWQLVKDRRLYPYSSACFYDSNTEIKPIIEVEYLWDYFFGIKK